jgi:hypothetical protein
MSQIIRGQPTPTYLSDPLFPVCVRLCPTYQVAGESLLDQQCLSVCGQVLSQWGATLDSQLELLSMLEQARADVSASPPAPARAGGPAAES